MKDRRKLSWLVIAVGVVIAGVFFSLVSVDQKRFNAQRKEETLLRTTLVNSDAAVLAINKEGMIVLVTPRLLELTGYTEPELIGQNAHILMPLAYRKAHDSAYNQVTAGEKNPENHVLCQVERKDGSNIAVVNNVFAYSGGGVAIITPAIGSFVEQKIHAMVLETAKVGVWWWEVDDDRLVWDNTMYSIYGVSEDTWTPTYAGFEKLVHPDDRKWLSDLVAHCVKTKTPYRAVFRVVRDSGNVAYVRAYGNVFDSPSGNVFAGVNIRTTAEEYTGKPE